MTTPNTLAKGDGVKLEGREPLPCPFCGSSDVDVERKTGFTNKAARSMWFNETVVCLACGGRSVTARRKRQAVVAWNRRAEVVSRSDHAEAKQMAAIRQLLADRGIAMADRPDDMDFIRSLVRACHSTRSPSQPAAPLERRRTASSGRPNNPSGESQ